MPILGIYASQITGHLYSNSFESIATQTVGAGGAASVTFSSIPSGYTHLQIRGIARTSFAGTASGLNARFNSDSGNNYAVHQIYGDGTSAGAYGLTTYSGANLTSIVGSTGLANTFGVIITDILDYTNTNKNKVVRTLGGKDLNGSGQASLYSALWLNTSAISSITIIPSDGSNLTQYSSFALYGVK